MRAAWLAALIALAAVAAPPPCVASGAPVAPVGEPLAAGDLPAPVFDAALTARAASSLRRDAGSSPRWGLAGPCRSAAAGTTGGGDCGRVSGQ